MIDPTPKLLLVAFGVCALVVAMGAGLRFQSAKRFWHAREVLTAAVVDASRHPDKIAIECRDCDWAELVASLPPVEELNCYDDAPEHDDHAVRGVRCRAFFEGAQCFDADIFADDGAWRLVTSGRVYRPCLP